MTATLHCSFSVAEWQENKLWQTGDGCSLATVDARYHYSGDIGGQSRIQMELMYYPSGESHFVGLEYIEAEIDGKQGGLVLRHTGTHNNHVASGDCELIYSSGELEGMRGNAHYEATSQQVELVLTLS